MARAQTKKTVEVKAPEWRTMEIFLVGTGPLVSNGLGPIARDGVIKNFLGEKPADKKKKPDVEVLREDTVHRDEEGRDCILSAAVKKAYVAAMGRVLGNKMTEAVLHWRCPEQLLPIKYNRREPIEFMARGKMGLVPCFCYIYYEWSVRLPIMFDAAHQSEELIVNGLAAAGNHVGIGKLRIERGGNYGTWKCETAKE